MNYSDFSFWWILLCFGVPFLLLRQIGKNVNLWPGLLDSLALAALSLILFFNASPRSFIIFALTLVFNYFMVRWMLQQQGWQAKAIATTVIIIDLAILAYFKYFSFFVEDILELVINIPKNWEETSPIPVSTRIPPGVSFYTFQMVSFVVDSFVSRRKKPIGFLDYVNFVTFFPQLVAGPIERRGDLLPQISDFRLKFKLDNFIEGMRWLSLGLFMKFVIADNLASYIELENATNPWLIWFFALLFALRIYFDFGGYSFIAVGLAKFLGVNLTINFLAPYTSISINEFWRRWHITLSTWFRDYLFIPLMGANKKWAPFYLFITFTLSGFWHGAAWNFILWGAYHGALLLVLRYLGRPFYGFVGQYFPKPQFISWALTFASVVLGCLFFMEINSRRLVAKILTICTPWQYSWSNLTEVFTQYNTNQATALIIILILSLAVLLLEFMAVWQKRYEYDLLLNSWVSPLLLGLTIILASTSSGQFIYFEF